MTTTLLGSNGRLGEIIKAYKRRDGTPWHSQSRIGNDDITWSGDVTGERASQVFRRGATLINSIGATSGDPDHLYDINVRFVQDLLSASASAGVAHVMLFSSAAIYGDIGDHACVERDDPSPITPYGQSKVAMERAARVMSNDPAFAAHGPAITILRIGNVAGADTLISAARHHVDQGAPVPLHRFDDGNAARRSYIGPRDLYAAIKALHEPKFPFRTVNVAHPQAVTLDALLQAYKAHVLPDLAWVDTSAPRAVPPSVTLDSDTLQRVVAFPHHINPADSLGAQVAEYLSL